MIPLLIAVGSAVMSAAGFVLQQHEAATAPSRSANIVGLLADLVRRPVWLAGIASMVLGQLLSALALSQGDLTLVEPGYATMLVFALVMSALWRRRRPRWQEWAGAVVLSSGVAGFVIAAHPSGGAPIGVATSHWLLAGGIIAAAVVVCAGAARRAPVQAAAAFLGACAGVLFGTQDALTRRSLLILAVGPVVLLRSWSGYMLVIVAMAAIATAQRAFQMAPLPASLPAVTIGEPITGILLGTVLYAERVALGSGSLAAESVSLLAMIIGLFIVARSPIVHRCADDPKGEAR